MSGIEIARCVLKPDSLIFVDKMNKLYYQGDYTLIANLTNFALDFYMLQSFLNGTNFSHFADDSILPQVVDSEIGITVFYQQRSHLTQDLLIFQEISYDNSFNVVKNRVEDLATLQELVINYSHYSTTDSIQRFFNHLECVIEDEEMTINLELKSIKFNVPGPTSIKIPDTFTPIIVEKN